MREILHTDLSYGIANFEMRTSNLGRYGMERDSALGENKSKIHERRI